MKTLILTTVAAAAIAFTAGSALASQDTDRATQWQVIEESGSPAHRAPVRHFTSSPAYQSTQTVSPTASDNAQDQAEREKVQTWGR